MLIIQLLYTSVSEQAPKACTDTLFACDPHLVVFSHGMIPIKMCKKNLFNFEHFTHPKLTLFLSFEHE
jgi:hypothetical protein